MVSVAGSLRVGAVFVPYESKKMQLKAMIVGDETKPWAVDGKNGETRTLSCIEALSVTSGRFVQQVFVKIPVTGAKQGDPKQGATLLGMNVVLTLTEVKQNNETKRVEFRGDVLEVVSSLQEVGMDGKVAVPAPKAPTEGKA